MTGRDVSDGRKALYYLGMILSIVGILIFLSVFVTFAAGFSDPLGAVSQGPSMMLRAFCGMILAAIGNGLRVVGSRGMAGSGLLLDPQQARRDVEPWSRMGGGMLADAIDESGLKESLQPVEEVKVRCRECRALNDETARFCDQCGKPL